VKSNKYLRIGLLILALALFAYYFLTNQHQFARLADLSLLQMLLVFIGQSIIFFSNILILVLFVKLIRGKIAFLDATRITAYSSLINFFGFLQGGLGFRGIYLKKYFGMTLKRYFALTSVQYLMLFGIAGLFVITGLGLTTGDSQVMAFLLIGVLVASAIVAFLYMTKSQFFMQRIQQLRGISIAFQARPLMSLGLIVLFQLGGSLLAYSSELSAVGAHISFGGLLIYTGVSQFSIVVALTPGAIGIREGLLLIAQNQMNLSTQDIVLAATIDRVIYFIILALLAPLAISVKRRLPQNTIEPEV
jgi:uncharacterized membrane protein YbhN (UPF0104 family)